MKYLFAVLFVLNTTITSAITFRFENQALQNMKAMIAAPGNTYYVLNEFNGTQLSYLDSNLNMVWQKTLSTGGVNSMSRCMNGDLLFTGQNGNDLFAFRTDSLGNAIWSNSFSHPPHWSVGKKIIEHSSGDIFVIGSVFESLFGDSAEVFLFIKLDSAGNLVWEFENGPQHTSYGLDLAESATGELLVGIEQFSLNGFHGEANKFDVNGWQHWWTWISTYWGLIAGYMERICPTDNGGCLALVAVPNQNLNPAFILYSIIGTNGNSGIEMQYEIPKSIGGTYSIANVDLVQTEDKGFALAGTIDIPNFSKIILKVDSLLIPQWCKVYPSTFLSNRNFIFQTSDQGYVFASNDSGVMILIKTDSLGNAYCNDSSVGISDTLLSNYGADSIFFMLPFTPQFNSMTYPVSETPGNISNWDTLCFDISTNIFEYSNELKIYPNPASEQLVIQLKSANASQLEIYNLTGTPIFSQNIFGLNLIELNCEKFDPGFYYVSVSFENGERVVSKIVIMR